METVLISGSTRVNINWNFKTGDKNNKLPANRYFLVVELLNTIIEIENAWDLLYTYSVKDVAHVNGKYYDYIFKKISETTITMFNSKRCIITNRLIDIYTICIIWNVDLNTVDFLCKFVDDNNIPVLMTSEKIVERYGIDILVV